MKLIRIMLFQKQNLIIKTFGKNEFKKFAIFKHTYCQNCQLGFGSKIKVPGLARMRHSSALLKLENSSSNSLLQIRVCHDDGIAMTHILVTWEPNLCSQVVKSSAKVSLKFKICQFSSRHGHWSRVGRKDLRGQPGFYPITVTCSGNSNHWRESLLEVIMQNIAG